MNTTKTIKTSNSIILVLTALIWGVAFVAQTEGGDAVGPLTFNCVRCIIGSLTLIPVIYVLDGKKRSLKVFASGWCNPTLIAGGISCGIILCIATNLQQLGITMGTSAGKAGFLTACYILIVPIIGIFSGKPCRLNIWLGVLLALIGLYLLCMKGSFSLQLADALILLCALCFSFHIVVIDHFSPLVDCVRMSCIQFMVSGILTAIPMFIWEPGSFQAFNNYEVWIPILYAGVFSCGVAYTLQIVGQRGFNPTIASLILSLESVFAAIAGWFLLNQTMDLRQILGCFLIFVAIILAQINLPTKANY